MLKRSLLTILLVLISINAFAVDSSLSITETQNTATATNLGLHGSHTWDIAVDPSDNNYIYIATFYSPNGFFRSNDGGKTWTALPNDVDHGSGHDVEVHPTNGHVYALLNDLLVSKDNGATYTVAAELGSGAGTLLFALNTLFVTQNSDVKISSDEGANFSTVTICSGETIWSLAADASSLYALCYNYTTEVASLYKSTDTGATWTNLNLSGATTTNAEKVAVNPSTKHVFLIPSSTGGSHFRSTDGGTTFTELTGAPQPSGHMAFNSTGRVYIGWHYSDDNGDSWTDFGKGGDYNHIITVDPTDDTILYDGSNPGFWKSTDSGANWTSSVDGVSAVEVTSIAQATNKDTVWVATQNGPAKTANFTADAPDWSYVSVVSGTYYSSGYDAVWVKADDPNVVVASSSSDLHYSTNGGSTWTKATVDITLSGAVFQIVNDSSGNLYGTVGPNTATGTQTGDVIKSTDNGANWTGLGFPSSGATRSVAVATNGTLYVGAHSSVGGVYKYDGTTWSKLTAPDTLEYRSILIDPDDTSTIYALASGTTSNSAAGIYKSSDGGTTWTQSLGDLSASDFTEFNTLAIQTSTSPNTLYFSAVANNMSRGVIYKSSDGGASWKLYFTGKKSETFKALLFDGLVGGATRGVYDFKSLAKLKVKKGSSSYIVTLKDKITNKKLSKQVVKLRLKKKKGAGKVVAKGKTNKKGKATLKASVSSGTKLYAQWVPKKAAYKAEYTTAISKTFKAR